MSNVKPKMDHSERAARDLLNHKVREGVIDRQNANQILKTGLPFVRTMLAEWHRDNCSPTWITGKLQDLHAEAEAKYTAANDPLIKRIVMTRVVAVEMYLAVWAGMQDDLGQTTTHRRSKPELKASSARGGYIYNESSMGYDKFDRVQVGSRVRVSDLWSVPGVGTVTEKAYHPGTRKSWIDVDIPGFGVHSYHPTDVHPLET